MNLKCICEGDELFKNATSINIDGCVLNVTTHMCACGSVDEDFFIKFCPLCGKELKRRKYSFNEAFEAYEMGLEIESCYSHNRYLKINNLDYSYNCFDNCWNEFNNGMTTAEIRGLWYLNSCEGDETTLKVK